MVRIFDRLNPVLDFLYKAVRMFGTVMLAALVCLTGSDVFMRYVFNNPVLGSNEMTQFLLGAVVFSGFVLVTAHRSHIVVSLFETILTERIPFLYKSLVSGFNLVGIIAITWVAFKYTSFQRLMGTETEILEFQWWHLGVVFIILSSIGILFGVKALTKPRRQGSYVPLKNAVNAQNSPFSVELEGEKKYAWCACGLSKKQPFCDGSHKGTEMKPVVFTAPISGLTNLCGCKQSNNAPYCNGAHKDL